MKTRYNWTIIAIIVAFVCLQIVLAPNKSLFFDEAAYVSAGMRLLSGNNDNYGTWFSGSPYMAPILYGLGYLAGNELGARLIAALFLALAMCAVARATRNIFDESTSIFAVLVFASVPNTVALGHLAVHDVPAICFVAWSFWAVSRQAKSSNRLWSILAGCLLGIASVTKYPFIIMAAPMASILIALRGRKSFLDISAFAMPIASAIGVYYALVGQELIDGLSYVGGLDYGATTRMDQVMTHLRYAVWVLPLAIIGAWFSWKSGRHMLALVLLGSLFLWPAFHTLRISINSQNKHVVLGFVLASPLCGLALAEVWNRRRNIALIASIALVGFGLWQSVILNNYWTDTTQVNAILRQVIKPGEPVFATNTSWTHVAPLWRAGNIESPWNIHDDFISQPLDLCSYKAVVVEKRSDGDYPLGVLDITPEALAQCGFEVAHRDYQTLYWMGSNGRYTSIRVEQTLYLMP